MTSPLTGPVSPPGAATKSERLGLRAAAGCSCSLLPRVCWLVQGPFRTVPYRTYLTFTYYYYIPVLTPACRSLVRPVRCSTTSGVHLPTYGTLRSTYSTYLLAHYLLPTNHEIFLPAAIHTYRPTDSCHDTTDLVT